MAPCQHPARVNCAYILERRLSLSHSVPAYSDVSAHSDKILATGSHAQESIIPCCWYRYSCHCLCKLQTCNSRLLTFLFSFQVSHLVFRYCEPKSRQSRLVLLLVVPVFLLTPISYTGTPLYSSIPLTFTTYTGALILFTLSYRLSPFHPLAKYPGPVIAKTSKWWAAYISARGDSHRTYKYLHDIYGDVVRIGRGRCLLFLSIPLPIVRTQRTLNSRCFPYSPCSRQRWPTERTTCVHAICIISTMVAHQHMR